MQARTALSTKKGLAEASPESYPGPLYPGGLQWRLLERCQLAKQTVSFALNSSREKQFVRASGAMPIAEGKTPQAIDRDRRPVSIFEETERSSSRRVERVDPPVAEVANQQRVAECPEVRRSQRNPPGRIQRPLCHQALYEPTVRPKHIHEAMAIPPNIVVPLGVLLREGYINLLADGLNPEWRVVAGYVRIPKRLDVGKIRVIHLDFAVAKIRGVDKRSLRSRNHSVPFVYRPKFRMIDATRLGIVHHGDGIVQINARTPSRQRAVFRGKNKERGAGNHVFAYRKAARSVKDNPGRSSSRAARCGRHRHD